MIISILKLFLYFVVTTIVLTYTITLDYFMILVYTMMSAYYCPFEYFKQ